MTFPQEKTIRIISILIVMLCICLAFVNPPYVVGTPLVDRNQTINSYESSLMKENLPLPPYTRFALDCMKMQYINYVAIICLFGIVLFIGIKIDNLMITLFYYLIIVFLVMTLKIVLMYSLLMGHVLVIQRY